MKSANVINGIDLRAHGGLIAKMAHRYRRFVGGCLEWEDLMQAGWFGLHKAAEKFDYSRGVKFSTYAGFWIRAFVQRAILNERRTVRVPVHKQTDAYQRGERIALNALSLDAPLDSADPDSAAWVDFLRSDSDPSQDAERSDLEARVGAAVDTLGEKGRRIIRARYWRDRKLGEIGADMGVSRERIRQREADALERLEAKLREVAANV